MMKYAKYLGLTLLLASHMVYQNAEGIWDARMNQTDIGKNNNKYYILQLQHPIGNSGVCTLFTHWGRLGENGQKQVKVNL